MKGFLLLPLFGLFAAAPLWAQSTPAPTPTPTPVATATPPPSLTQSTSVLGKLFGVSFNTQANSAQNGMTLSLNATILGSNKSLVQSTVAPTATFTDGNLQVYVNGAQISAVSGAFANANWADTVTFPPINTSGTIVTVPIGPLTIAVDGGYSLSGNLNTDVALNFAVGETSAPPSGIEATLGTKVAAAGWLQGSVSLIFIRGGLKGTIDAAEGSVQTKADLYFGKTPPAFTATGELGFFAGSVSAFADYNSFFAGWQNFWNWTIVSWNGFCFNFANGVKVGGQCSAQ